jgi:hypothetical protein
MSHHCIYIFKTLVIAKIKRYKNEEDLNSMIIYHFVLRIFSWIKWVNLIPIKNKIECLFFLSTMQKIIEL